MAVLLLNCLLQPWVGVVGRGGGGEGRRRRKEWRRGGGERWKSTSTRHSFFPSFLHSIPPFPSLHPPLPLSVTLSPFSHPFSSHPPASPPFPPPFPPPPPLLPPSEVVGTGRKQPMSPKTLASKDPPSQLPWRT